MNSIELLSYFSGDTNINQDRTANFLYKYNMLLVKIQRETDSDQNKNKELDKSIYDFCFS